MHIKPLLSNPSLSQIALTSQGSLRQGSGTRLKTIRNAIYRVGDQMHHGIHNVVCT